MAVGAGLTGRRAGREATARERSQRTLGGWSKRVTRWESLAQEGGLGSLGWGEVNRLSLQGICSQNPLAEASSPGWCENLALEGGLTRVQTAGTEGQRRRKKARARRHDNLTPGLAFELVF